MTDKAIEVKEANVVPVVVVNQSPATMLETLITKEMTPQDMLAILDVQKQWEANEAKKAYVRAMAAFKANPPEIFKTAVVDFTNKAGQRTNYNHADFGEFSEQINRSMGVFGLSSGFKLAQPDGQVKVTCIITHELGHSEETSLTAPPDVTGNKNGIQAIASTQSYLSRYTLVALTGCVAKELAHGMDDDGNAAGGQVETISEEQYFALKDMAEASEGGMKRFMKYLKSWPKPIEKIDDIPAKHFQEIHDVLAAIQK